jgi:branched-chain amino acid transport system ATP-binding protein
MSDLLRIEALDAYYGDFQALYSINLALDVGEVVAIIGANGAGKSTLMKSITGLLFNKTEEVVFQGEKIGALRADQIAKLGIALVPEGRQLFPSLSVEENLLLGSNVARSGPWNLSKIYELFPILKERRRQQSTSLSGGQQQMVAIGRALMSNPKLILFDEISLGLAPIIVRDIYTTLPKIIDEGIAAMLVEQDLSKALEVSSRVYCLQEGKISLSGNVGDVSRDEITNAYFGINK